MSLKIFEIYWLDYLKTKNIFKRHFGMAWISFQDIKFLLSVPTTIIIRYVAGRLTGNCVHNSTYAWAQLFVPCWHTCQYLPSNFQFFTFNNIGTEETWVLKFWVEKHCLLLCFKNVTEECGLIFVAICLNFGIKK